MQKKQFHLCQRPGTRDTITLVTSSNHLPCRPRWLVEHNKLEQARKSLHFFREGSYTQEQTELELAGIQKTVSDYHASGVTWKALFVDRSLFARLWRASVLQFMAQMCGATAMKYYLPTLFKVLGLGTRLSLLAGGIESTLKIGCTVIEMLVIDRVGRRLTMSFGAAVMAFAMLVCLNTPATLAASL